LIERNKRVSLMIRRRAKPGLQATLGLHRGGGWINPPGRQKEQRSQRPENGNSDGEP
jgi:hypothetical protein